MLLIIQWGDPKDVPAGQEMLQFKGEGWELRLPIFHSPSRFAWVNLRDGDHKERIKQQEQYELLSYLFNCVCWKNIKVTDSNFLRLQYRSYHDYRLTWQLLFWQMCGYDFTKKWHTKYARQKLAMNIRRFTREVQSDTSFNTPMKGAMDGIASALLTERHICDDMNRVHVENNEHNEEEFVKKFLDMHESMNYKYPETSYYYCLCSKEAAFAEFKTNFRKHFTEHFKEQFEKDISDSKVSEAIKKIEDSIPDRYPGDSAFDMYMLSEDALSQDTVMPALTPNFVGELNSLAKNYCGAIILPGFDRVNNVLSIYDFPRHAKMRILKRQNPLPVSWSTDELVSHEF